MHTNGESFADSYLLYMLAQASDAASGAFHSQLAERNIPVSTWRILASLYPGATLNVGDLAKKCLAKQSTLSRQLDGLCRAGLAVRRHERNDRRGVLVCLTPEGRALASDLIQEAKAQEAEILSRYSKGEIDTFKSVLADITSLFDLPAGKR